MLWIGLTAIALWIVCGVLTYGIALANAQRKYPRIAKESYRDDCAFAAFFSLLGPIGLFVTFFMSAFAKHGLMWRRP